MKHISLLNEFREELTSLSREIETSSSMGHFDINKVCEDLVCGLFRELFGLAQLRNLNNEEKQNFPGIDLADDQARIAIQVTSTPNLGKIKDSITTFLRYKFNDKYDRLIVFILTKKQGSYSQSAIDQSTQEAFLFDVIRDVMDYTDLAAKAANVSPQILTKAVSILRSYTRGCDEGLSDEDFDPPTGVFEEISANLVELYFPATLYVADLIPEALETSNGRRARNQRKQIRKFLTEMSISVPSDYEINGGKLITFHDLENRHNPYEKLIDEGTVTPLNPKDFCSINVDHERIFKSLLRFVLQQKLYKHRVLWQHLEWIFIFLPMKDNHDTRKENWTGLKRSTRTVFERKYKKNKPSEVLSTKHFAFSTDFLILSGKWYLSITPDWFFSYEDSYSRSGFSDMLISGLKRLEKNRSVFDQFRFLSCWLSTLDSEDIFSLNEQSEPTLSFGSGVNFLNAPKLNENHWEPLRSDDNDEYETSTQDLFNLI